MARIIMLEDELNFVGTHFSRFDERGSFTKLFGQSPVGEIKFEGKLRQVNYVRNELAGTLRGLHYQVGPFEESKIVHCIRGSVWDVVVDIRTDSSTYKEWYGEVLAPSQKNFMKVPRGFAHGYITLEDETELIYFSDNELSLEHERGIVWNDENINITWPVTPSRLSAKDQNWPKFTEEVK
jgi:dTDP-4-dehydrorhamnose 3,5-epimerase